MGYVIRMKPDKAVEMLKDILGIDEIVDDIVKKHGIPKEAYIRIPDVNEVRLFKTIRDAKYYLRRYLNKEDYEIMLEPLPNSLDFIMKKKE